ncbi:hypothetical protein DFP73DRAFT_635906 [Morchella snyderi]|nr:hypothetical protein DFP73DRAFT_635906 [Morchella snyderi]
MSGKHQMSKSDASRIQSTQEKGNKDTSSGSFASRAQSTADRNAAAQNTPKSSDGGTSGSQAQGAKK